MPGDARADQIEMPTTDYSLIDNCRPKSIARIFIYEDDDVLIIN